MTPWGIGLVVLLGTVLGLWVHYPLDRLHGFLIIGAIHGVFAMAATWAASEAYRYFVKGAR